MSFLQRIEVAPRAQATSLNRVGVPLLALLAALVIGGIVLILTGANPFEVYRTMLDASLNGRRPIERTLTFSTPLILTGLAAAIAFRMKLYTIGAEGQLFMGAIAASAVAIQLPATTPAAVMLTCLVLAGAVAGALWAGLAAIPKALFGTDEIITTLMLNFIALAFMNYLIFGAQTFWRDPDRPVPQGLGFPDAAELPDLSGRLHLGFALAVVLAIVLWWVLNNTTFGFRVRTIGDSKRAAAYAGVGVSSTIITVFFLSGALAGLAGAIEVSAVTNRLDPTALAIELGYTGIIIAAVARLNPLGVLPVAVFLAAIETAGSSLQGIGVDVEIVRLLQGLIFLSVTTGEFFVANRVGLKSKQDDTKAAPDSKSRGDSEEGQSLNLSRRAAVVAPANELVGDAT